ncbi:phospholipid scramblase-related protein [Pyxidicoccus sp. MSG2]|uniref:phospholipid scramblase-related protein n=1 Tax=Pyxidicoccus sp. MSG2 TaxID=2996790 RepID=UPI00226D6D70|nr:phospholipid scramblase-related protein [Pyxidicoccus sp. MSG2]MCY1018013.1 phospholipid scramblase-related protein [Pyxidicoccus sp. MSG2]
MSNKPKLADTQELELDWGGREQRSPSPSGDVATADAALLAEVPVGEPGKGPPGDPRYMSHELRMQLAGMFEAPELRMRQMRELAEILIGWESKNRYEVCDPTGRPAVYVGETGSGWGSALVRNFWPFYKARLECMTLGGTVALAIERPWSFLFSRANVEAWDGRPLATIQQRFTFFGRRFDVVTPGGAVIATVEGPLFRPWTFRILQRGVEVAVVRKRWSGLLQETFTDADTFTLEFKPDCADARLRQMVLAVALLVDLTYFDNRSRKSSFGAGFDIFDFWK